MVFFVRAAAQTKTSFCRNPEFPQKNKQINKQRNQENKESYLCASNSKM